MSKILDAVYAQDIESVRKILTETPNAVDETDDHGVCVCLLAAKTGNLELMRYITEYSRASLNICDSRNRNALHYAAYTDNVALTEYLTQKVGLSPLAGDKEGITPLHIASEMGNLSVLRGLEDSCGCSLDEMYANPIRPGTFPDPSIVRVGEDYYMVNSSFVYFPAIPVSHSKDLIHWEIIGHAITDPAYAALEELESGRGYWAPDISFYEGKFYIAATYRLNDTGTVYRKQIVVSSDKPEGPYSKPAIFDEDGIDPSIFNDDDGRRYMLLNRGARIFEISQDATRPLSEATLLWYGDNKRAPEGPHLLKKDGYYYLFLAEGGTGMGHRISVGRSKTLMGKYESCPYNPIMRQRDPDAQIQRAGHGKPVQTQNGEWYMIYLCGRPLEGGYTILGRETALDPIAWTADGWPIVNGLRGPSTLQIKPKLPSWHSEKRERDDFDTSTLSLDWMAPRDLSPQYFSLLQGSLWITGSEYDLCHIQNRSLLVRRQTNFCFEAQTRVQVSFEKQDMNAGMACFYDENTYIKFGIFKSGEVYRLCVIEHVGQEEHTAFESAPFNTGEIR